MATFCAKYKITHLFSTTYYSQGNGQVEINNHTIFDSLCKSPGKVKGKWVEKLSAVLWACRTTKHIPMSETPFSLAYGTKAIILVDVYMPTLCMEEVDWDQNTT